MSKLEGKVIAIIGATGGIGAPLAEMSVGSGAKVLLGSRRVPELTDLQMRIDPSGKNTLATPTDASKPKSVLALLEEGFQEFDKVDIVIVSVGTWRQVSFETELGDAGEAGSILANSIVIPSWNAIFESTRFLAEHGGGAVLNVSSHAVLKSEGKLKKNVYYRAAKVAVENVIESLRPDAEKKGVRLVNLRPAIVDTPQNRKENPAVTEDQWALAVKPITIFHWIENNADNLNLEDPEFPSKFEL